MDCTQAREEFSALLDGELAPDERTAVESHLSLCSECLRELDGLKRVDVAYRQLAPVAAPQGFEDRVREELRSRVILRLPRLGRRRGPVWPALAVAAAVLLVLGTLVVQLGLPEATRMQMAEAPAMESASPSAGRSSGDAAPATTEGILDSAAISADAVAPPAERMMAQSPPPASPAPAAAPAPAPPVKGVVRGIASAPAAAELRRERAPEALMDAESAGALAEASPEPPSDSYFGSAQAEMPPAEPPEASLPPAEAPPAVETEANAPMAKVSLGRPLADAPQSQTVGQRTFFVVEGEWQEAGYGNEETETLVRGSEALRKLVEAHPELGEALELGERVVFKIGDRWYRVLPRQP